MAESNYLRPKAKTGSLGDRKKVNGMFQNIPNYPQFGGFYGSGKWPEAQRALGLEKGELTRKGKPV